MSHDCDRIAFLESCYASCSDGYAPVDVTSPTLFCGSNGFLAGDTTPFYPVCKVLPCWSSAFLDDDTVEGLDCSSLALGEACVVTCADRYIAAGDTETTLTCVLNPELTGGFCSFMRVGAVRPQHTRASFHCESRLPEHSLPGVLHCQLLVWQCSDFRDRVFRDQTRSGRLSDANGS